MSLVLSKASEPSKDDVQLQMAALNNHQLEVKSIGDKKQFIEYSECKDFDNIKCVFLLLITWDVVLLVVVVSLVDFMISSCCRRFSVLWPILLLCSKSQGTIQKCPQGYLQVW